MPKPWADKDSVPYSKGPNDPEGGEVSGSDTFHGPSRGDGEFHAPKENPGGDSLNDPDGMARP